MSVAYRSTFRPTIRQPQLLADISTNTQPTNITYMSVNISSDTWVTFRSTYCNRLICRPRVAQIRQDPEVVSQSINQCTQIQESKQNLALYTYYLTMWHRLFKADYVATPTPYRYSISVSRQVSQSAAQSVSQFVSPSMSHLVSQSLTHSACQPVSYIQLVNKAGIQQVSHSVSHLETISHSVRQSKNSAIKPVTQTVSQSVTQQVSQSVSKPANQSVSKPARQSGSPSISQSVGC